MAEISNQQQTLTFNVKLGLLKEIGHADGSKNVVDEEIAMYSSYRSGAYLFKPKGEAQSIIQDEGLVVISEGPLMSECTLTRKHNGKIARSLIVPDSMMKKFLVEKEYHVELIGAHFNDQEIIVRYKTDIDNERIFYSDLNGCQMNRRETYYKIPLQGNYYPMAFMQGSDGRRFSVHSKQSLGAASLKSSWLEIMVDPRLLRDDGRGLGQGVTNECDLSHPRGDQHFFYFESCI